jgi:hypothetical protein
MSIGSSQVGSGHFNIEGYRLHAECPNRLEYLLMSIALGSFVAIAFQNLLPRSLEKKITKSKEKIIEIFRSIVLKETDKQRYERKIDGFFKKGFFEIRVVEHIVAQGILPECYRVLDTYQPKWIAKTEISLEEQKEVVDAIQQIQEMVSDGVHLRKIDWDYWQIRSVMQHYGMEESFGILESKHSRQDLLRKGPLDVLGMGTKLVSNGEAGINLEKYTSGLQRILERGETYIPAEKKELAHHLVGFVHQPPSSFSENLDKMYQILSGLTAQFDQGSIDTRAEFCVVQGRFANKMERIRLLSQIMVDIDTPLNTIDTSLQSYKMFRIIIDGFKNNQTAALIFFNNLHLKEIYSRTIRENPEFWNAPKTLLEVIGDLKRKGAEVCGW